jgi:hypothetical protein
MSLKFDGKSNWKAFYAKFSRYAEVSEWTEGECRDQLCWCLDGKASEYYALLVERNQEMVYMDLILAYPIGFSGSLLGGHPGLFSLLGTLGIVPFVPPGPSMSSPLGR